MISGYVRLGAKLQFAHVEGFPFRYGPHCCSASHCLVMGGEFQDHLPVSVWCVECFSFVYHPGSAIRGYSMHYSSYSKYLKAKTADSTVGAVDSLVRDGICASLTLWFHQNWSMQRHELSWE